MPEVCDGIRTRLFLLADPAYRAFQQPLIPTVPPERVIGVRTPALRALARELAAYLHCPVAAGELLKEKMICLC